MNAMTRETVKRHQRTEQQFLRLNEVSSEATKMGFRAAEVLTTFLRFAIAAGKVGRGLWRALMEQPGLVVRKGPNGEYVELFEEYRVLHEAQPLSPFLRR